MLSLLTVLCLLVIGWWLVSFIQKEYHKRQPKIPLSDILKNKDK